MMKSYEKNMDKRKNERGNALFFILIGVVLFAALSYTVGNMMRGGNAETIADEKAGLYADEILDYGRILRQAVQGVKISGGCLDGEISFETAGLTGYTNGTNTACQVFNSNGGDINYIKINSAVTSSDWVFTGTNIVDSVGTAAPDLVAILPDIKLSICEAINETSGITALGTDADIDFTKFTGTYAGTQTLDFADGKMNGCLNYVNSGNNYFFYQVLVKR